MSHAPIPPRRPSRGEILVLLVGIAANFLALKAAMQIPLAFVYWAAIALFWLPMLLVPAGLIALARGHRPRLNPITVSGSIIVGNTLFWGLTTHDNRMTTFNLIVGGATYISMYLAGLFPLLVAIAIRRRYRRTPVQPT